ncbi:MULTISPECIES: hypothetical protein [unclassified Paenibacillus]|uniref:hypothetical protein n=1 Tax=unclassified Paenibacillus TaxID=185978 RepID=UPI001C11D3FB|nr:MULTISPECIES: hypothetical protein [unclassified Paenibacillus]MBU5444567.1 hypothetical protein [Paenibacillus sp. MSJ-34]CAH0120228.1 hypothetical protein PAE9249_02744 [Paenibacillus sp. CECT 9249]
MFGFWLFLHLAGLFLWLGALLAKTVVLGMLQKQLGSETGNTLAQRVIRTFSLFAHPGAVLVLISGVFLIIQMGLGKGKPVWLEVMEKGGGMIIILALIITGIWGSKVRRRLRDGSAQAVKLNGYLTVLAGFMVLILGVVLVVSLRI